jgi:ribose transport system substrate-binding protein
MTHSTKLSLACTTALIALGGAASAQSVTIGITQNNVGVDSYQTTYEQAFIAAAADENDDVEVVVLDAGGDVARQIAQIQDLIQQDVDAMIIWPTNGQAVIPAVREAYQAEIPVIITNSNIAEDGFDFVTSFSGPDNITQGARSAEIMCDKFKEWASRTRPASSQITGQPGYTTAIERAKGFEERLPEVCPNVTLVDSQPGNWNRENSAAGDGSLPRPVRRHRRRLFRRRQHGRRRTERGQGRRTEGIIFVGATNFAVGYDAMERGEYWGSIYQSPVDDAEAALQTALDVLAGEDVPFLNYFDTPKITQDNMDEFTKPVF